MFKIGNTDINSGIFLAPLAGISSLPFRLICRQFGCEFAYLEMVNARSLTHIGRQTMQILKSCEEDAPLGVQLIGCEEKYILNALEQLQGYDFETLDFNAGCPQKKVTNRGEGAALLREPEKLQRLVSVLVKNLRLPVTVKMRIGWDSNKDAVEIAQRMQDAGAACLCVHGRTREQFYSGAVDYAAIKAVKDALEIPVVGSGDILSPVLAKKMFDETGCDAAIVARGALGNPWIFPRTKEFLSTGKLIPLPSPAQVAEVMHRHLELNMEFYGKRSGILVFRKFFVWYTRGFSKIKPLREKVNSAKTAADMKILIEKFQHTAIIKDTLH